MSFSDSGIQMPSTGRLESEVQVCGHAPREPTNHRQPHPPSLLPTELPKKKKPGQAWDSRGSASHPGPGAFEMARGRICRLSVRNLRFPTSLGSHGFDAKVSAWATGFTGARRPASVK